MIDFVDDKFLIDGVEYTKVSAFADALYTKYLSATNIKPLIQSYRFVVNGMDYKVSDFEDVLHYIIYDYQTFDIRYTSDYSQVELDLIDVFLNYQIKIGAKTKPIKEHKKIRDFNILPQVQKKELLNKLFRGDGNTGVIYIPSIDLYTSSTLYSNPVKKYNSETKKYYKYRYVGDLLSVVLKTLLIDCNYEGFKQPCYHNKVRLELSSFKTLLGLVIVNGPVEVINDRYYLSSQQKHILKYVSQILINRGKDNGAVL